MIERVDGMLTFRREGKNRYTRATREVATRHALKQRGVARETIAAVMDRTISHVGESDLSAGQWLAIALGYLDEAL